MALLAQLTQISDASLGNPGAMAAVLPLVTSHSLEKVLLSLLDIAGNKALPTPRRMGAVLTANYILGSKMGNVLSVSPGGLETIKRKVLAGLPEPEGMIGSLYAGPAVQLAVAIGGPGCAGWPDLLITTRDLIKSSAPFSNKVGVAILHEFCVPQGYAILGPHLHPIILGVAGLLDPVHHRDDVRTLATDCLICLAGICGDQLVDVFADIAPAMSVALQLMCNDVEPDDAYFQNVTGMIQQFQDVLKASEKQCAVVFGLLLPEWIKSLSTVAARCTKRAKTTMLSHIILLLRTSCFAHAASDAEGASELAAALSSFLRHLQPAALSPAEVKKTTEWQQFFGKEYSVLLGELRKVFQKRVGDVDVKQWWRCLKKLIASSATDPPTQLAALAVLNMSLLDHDAFLASMEDIMKVLASLTTSKTIPIRATAMSSLNDFIVILNNGMRSMSSEAASAYAETVLPVIVGALKDTCACTRIAAFKAMHNVHPKLLLDGHFTRVFQERHIYVELLKTLDKSAFEPLEIRRCAAYALSLLLREDVERAELEIFALDMLDESPYSEMHASCLACVANPSFLGTSPRVLASILRTLQNPNVLAISKACDQIAYLRIAHTNIQRATYATLVASNCNHGEIRAYAYTMGMPFVSLRYIMHFGLSHGETQAEAMACACEPTDLDIFTHFRGMETVHSFVFDFIRSRGATLPATADVLIILQKALEAMMVEIHMWTYAPSISLGYSCIVQIFHMLLSSGRLTPALIDSFVAVFARNPLLSRPVPDPVDAASAQVMGSVLTESVQFTVDTPPVPLVQGRHLQGICEYVLRGLWTHLNLDDAAPELTKKHVKEVPSSADLDAGDSDAADAVTIFLGMLESVTGMVYRLPGESHDCVVQTFGPMALLLLQHRTINLTFNAATGHCLSAIAASCHYGVGESLHPMLASILSKCEAILSDKSDPPDSILAGGAALFLGEYSQSGAPIPDADGMNQHFGMLGHLARRKWTSSDADKKAKCYNFTALLLLALNCKVYNAGLAACAKAGLKRMPFLTCPQLQFAIATQLCHIASKQELPNVLTIAAVADEFVAAVIRSIAEDTRRESADALPLLDPSEIAPFAWLASSDSPLATSFKEPLVEKDDLAVFHKRVDDIKRKLNPVKVQHRKV